MSLISLLCNCYFFHVTNEEFVGSLFKTMQISSRLSSHWRFFLTDLSNDGCKCWFSHFSTPFMFISQSSGFYCQNLPFPAFIHSFIYLWLSECTHEFYCFFSALYLLELLIFVLKSCSIVILTIFLIVTWYCLPFLLCNCEWWLSSMFGWKLWVQRSPGPQGLLRSRTQGKNWRKD